LNPLLAFTSLYNLLFEEKIQSYLTFLNVPQLERQREQTCKQDWVLQLTKNIYSKSFATRVIAGNSNIARVID
jgi:hypothetical protein